MGWTRASPRAGLILELGLAPPGRGPDLAPRHNRAGSSAGQVDLAAPRLQTRPAPSPFMQPGRASHLFVRAGLCPRQVKDKPLRGL